MVAVPFLLKFVINPDTPDIAGNILPELFE